MHCLQHDYMLIDCYMLYSKLSLISNGIPFQGYTLTVAQGHLKLHWASENLVTSRPGGD
jgi:hypothetical protein